MVITINNTIFCDVMWFHQMLGNCQVVMSASLSVKIIPEAMTSNIVIQTGVDRKP
jgi:hypothetical protein